MKFVYFLDKKLTFQHFFSSDVSQKEDFVFYFFSPERAKRPLLELID